MVAMLAGAAATGAGYGLAASSAQSGGALGPGTVVVQLDVHHSRFEPESLRVREGTLVRFVVHNGDPIRHELIVGPPDVHARHESGTEATHPPVPGEVTVDPSEVAETVYRFDEPGDVVFACHLPGHLQYGMRGTVEVLPID
jgi:uncharacterized cupredoxin-like copper-binding protein